MINHRIIDILKTFSGKEIKRFKEYLNSPFFNKSNKIIKFYDCLISFHPDFKSKNLTKENLYSKTGNYSVYSKSTIDNLLSDLLFQAENFLMIINFQDKEVKSKDFLIDELFKRNLDKLIETNIGKVQSLLKNKVIDTDYYLNTYKIITDELNHIHVNKARSGKSIIDIYVDKLSDRGLYLTCLFITEMIRGYDNILALNKTFEIDENSNFIFGIFKEMDFEKVLKYLISKTKKEDLSIVFSIYYNLYMAFSNLENEIYYKNYKKLFLKNLNIFSTDEKRFHFSRLIRYCKNKSGNNKSSGKYENELLQLHNYILTKGYYRSSMTKYLPVELFRTVLHLGLKLKKYKWTEEFINSFTKELHPDRRDNMYYFSLAELFFRRRSFPDSLKNLNKIELNHFMLKLDVRNLLLKTYYELCEFDSALSLIDSYNHFLKYDKTLSISEKERAKKFINILNKLILFKTDPKSKNKLKFNIDKKMSDDLLLDAWIKEKILKLGINA